MLRILQGDAIERLRELPSDSVHCCVTSPPYWGLRDYGTAEWEGGEANCNHLKPFDAVSHATSGLKLAKNHAEAMSNVGHKHEPYRDDCGKCGAKRIDSQLGLEKTPDEYVAKMVEIFREVRRVLRKDGTLWLNLGSSMAGSGKGRNGDGTVGKLSSKKQRSNAGASFDDTRPNQSHSGDPACGSGDKAQSSFQSSDFGCSDLCDECRAALSSRNSGSVEQPPESFSSEHSKVCKGEHSDAALEFLYAAVRDDPSSTKTESFPQLPALCSHCANCGACLSVLGSATRDASLCARRASSRPDKGETEQTWRSRMTDMVLSSAAWRYLTTESLKAKDDCAIPWLVCLALRMDGWYSRSPIIWSKPNPMPESVTDRPTKAHEYLFLLTKSAHYFYDAEAIKEESSPTCHSWKTEKPGDKNESRNGEFQVKPQVWRDYQPSNRNKRSVWTVATAPYAQAHFATYPPDLIKPCILAGTSARGCCAKCGAPWERVVEINYTDGHRGMVGNQNKKITDDRVMHAGRENDKRLNKNVETLGWQPTCLCKSEVGSKKEEVEPCTVLDPFAGSGTTGEVALELGRKAVLIELNPKYVELIETRCNVTLGLALA